MVTSLGYSNEHVQRAITRQLQTAPFGPVLHGTTDTAVTYADHLVEVLPGDLDRVFLLSGGSEATETL